MEHLVQTHDSTSHYQVLSDVFLLQLCPTSQMRTLRPRCLCWQYVEKAHCLLGAVSLHLSPLSRSLAAQVKGLGVATGLVKELE